MKILKTMLQAVVGVVIIVVLLLGIFLFYINTKDFMPLATEELQIIRKNQNILHNNAIELISWNIGYAGLGKEMDFFYDGGKSTRTTHEITLENIKGIADFMQSQPTVDFWLLQEVDFKAKRSYDIDESTQIAYALPQFNYVTAINYLVPFVPLPLNAPLGHVNAGMMSLSRFEPRLSRRYAYPLIAGWPDRMFLLDRCFIETRFSLGEGRELVVLNTHNSAFIKNQRLMDQELQVIHDKMLREYELGNYVVAGGDWNMNPPNMRPENGYNGHVFAPAAVKFASDFLPVGWQYNFDASAPSNRNLAKAYRKGDNTTTTIDFFITSPNISALSIETIDLGFAHSDHNPVKIKVLLQ